MPNRDGMVIDDWMIDEIHWENIDLDIPSYYPSVIDAYRGGLTWNFKLTEDQTVRLTKCIDCAYCLKLGNGEYRCKYGIHGGKPERKTCNYERKKR